MREYEDFARQYLNPGSTYGDEWAVRCPIHGDRRPSASYNVERGLFHCHACGAGGSTSWLASELGVPWESDVETSIDRAVHEMMTKTRKLRRMVRRPTEVRTVTGGGEDYWSKRHITAATMVEWGLGYDVLADTMLIPAHDETGELLGIIKRRMSGDGPKYKYPKGLRVGHILFGAHRYDHGDGPLVLVEGSIDAILLSQYGWRACAVLGSRLTDHQVGIIRRLGATDVIVAFDNDRAGRRATRRAMADLADVVITCRSYPWDKSDPKDPGEFFDRGWGQEFLGTLEWLKDDVTHQAQ